VPVPAPAASAAGAGPVEPPPAKLGSVAEHVRGVISTDRHQYLVHCVDWRSGKLLWSRIAHEGVPPGSIHPKGSHASETPITDGERVYAYFGGVGLYCFDMEGHELWSRKAGEAIPPSVIDYFRMTGEEMHQVAVGPIHAGIIEVGHFRFSVAGEPIMQLELHHFWKHRGVEKLFEQQQLTEAVPLAERVSGDTTVGHSLAYCQAVETLMQMEVPRRARYLRSFFLELERLYNHLGDVGAICTDVAYSLPHAHCGRMKEQIMQLNDRLTEIGRAHV
jgi:hypothetical protein